MSDTKDVIREMSVRLPDELFEQLERRARILGRPVELEARALIVRGLGGGITLHDELLALAERWVRQHLGIEGQTTVEIIRADRDGIPDAERFEELAGRYRPLVHGWQPEGESPWAASPHRPA
ncbi:MAG: hypothetical protein C0506_00925 [Anaerolinea sp.]|nr:hypothetical protein [Anaerolinea sp.]